MSAPADKVIEKVAKLLALAEHPNTGDAERDAFLARADALMAKHMIDEALVRAAQTPEERRKPVVVEVTEMFNRETVYGSKMELIAREVARTVNVKLVQHYSGRRRHTLVGFDEDVRWMQMLFMNIQMAFLTRISPKWSTERDFTMNVVLLRESGLSWSKVLDRAHRAGAVEDTWSDTELEGEWQANGWVDGEQRARWAAEDKLNRLYRNWCKAAGKKPVQITRHEAYRHTYAEAFTNRICGRLEEMRAARRASSGTGTELALREMDEDILAAMFDAFPELSPEAIKARREAEERRRREEDEKHAEWLASLTPAARLRYEKEQTAERAKQARESDRYWRKVEEERERLYDTNGGQAGRAAADSVNLSTAEHVDTTTREALA